MAKSDKSAMVSGAGLLAAFITDLFKQARELGASDEDLHRALSDATMIKRFAELVAEPDVQRITLKQPGSRRIDLEVQIRRGQYGSIDPEIRGLVPRTFLTALLPKELALIYPGKPLSSEEAFDLLDRRGYRPADFVELIVLGTLDHQFGTQFPVISLNMGAPSSIHQVLVIEPCFSNNSTDRQLVLLGSRGATWTWTARYLAVRK